MTGPATSSTGPATAGAGPRPVPATRTATLLVVDSGTTRTRVRTWHDGEVVWTGSEAVGARDTAADGHPDRIKAALARLVVAARTEAGVEPEAVVCSGMITANVGLLEVPHLPAPTGPDDTARAMVRRDFPDVADLPFYFVPGVKTLPSSGSLAALPEGDVLRGEEAEVVGLRELLGLQGTALLLHYGSHHKAIEVDPAGRILGSRTSITGELLSVVAGHTVLKSSLVAPEGLTLQPELWRAGLAAALEHGLGRALFLVRVGEQLGGRSKADMTSYLIGALTALDLPLVEGAARDGATVVLYGAGVFPGVMKAVLDERGYSSVLVDEATAERSAALGAVRLFERRLELDAAR